jgi:hypothetical protein
VRWNEPIVQPLPPPPRACGPPRFTTSYVALNGAFSLIREMGLILFGIRQVGHAVIFTQPASQVDQSTAITAKGEGGRFRFFELFLTNRTPHGYASFFLVEAVLVESDLASDFFSFLPPSDAGSEDDLSFSAAFLYESLR